ncbi:unnamed protein product, partial [marine sediment metagenome]
LSCQRNVGDPAAQEPPQAASKPARLQDPLILARAHHGKTVTVQAGQAIQIRLPGMWRVGAGKHPPLKIDVLEGPTNTLICRSRQGVADGRRTAINLKAQWPGKATATVTYAKPAADAAEGETFLVTIVVEPPATPPAARRQPQPIAPGPLSKALTKATGVTWTAWKGRDGPSSVSDTTGRSGAAMSYVFRANSQRTQGLILARFQDSARAMAIVWGGNHWTIVSDPQVWARNRDHMEK